MTTKSKKQKGYVSLIGIIIITFAGIAIVATLIWLATASTKTSITVRESLQARKLADLCAEIALNELKMSTNYTGNITNSYSEGACEILPILGTGNTNRIIQTRGVVGTVDRKVEIRVAVVSPQIQLTSWREVADF